jgi:2-keto-3-deoxy-L-rhamnonate aldolase RhmA
MMTLFTKEKSMPMSRVILSTNLCLALCLITTAFAQAQQQPAATHARIYNTAKQKLMDGKPIVGGTVATTDPNIYCAMATAGFDYLWIEMQHSPITYDEVAKMIRACKGSPAMPFIRVPDATEGDIQKAVDSGALGIIIPMVETVEKAEAAVKFAKYPPVGRRSQGGGQYGVLWGNDYRQTANDNIMIVAMIESPAGVDIADKIAAIPGVDVVFVASTDLGSFSGSKQGEPQYEALVKRIHDMTLKAGKKLGGPYAWKGRADYTFFQGPGEPNLIKAGADAYLGAAPSAGGKRGVAPTEGAEK